MEACEPVLLPVRRNETSGCTWGCRQATCLRSKGHMLMWILEVELIGHILAPIQVFFCQVHCMIGHDHVTWDTPSLCFSHLHTCTHFSLPLSRSRAVSIFLPFLLSLSVCLSVTLTLSHSLSLSLSLSHFLSPIYMQIKIHMYRLIYRL